MDADLILLVEDNPGHAALLSRSLTRAGYHVIESTDALNVVVLACDRRPDLILMDVSGAGQEGLEVCRALKSRPETAPIPVAFVASEADSAQVVEAFSAGCSEYITKPFVVDEVLARVSAHIRLRKVELELQQRNAELARLTDRLREVNGELAEQTRLDPLTQLFNRRAWQEAACIEQARSQRQGHPYSIAMIDADHFKAFNDAQGHQAGDECLRRMAKSIMGTCRGIDVAARYGGEEFVVLAPETDVLGARRLAERLRKGIWDLRIPHPHNGIASRVTVSIGVASGTGGSWEEVLRNADHALYMAKKTGRNMAHASVGLTGSEHAHSQGAVGRPRAGGTGAGEKASVQIVADEAATRQGYRQCLEPEDYQIHEVKDVSAALEKAREVSPDVILVDVSTPRGDALECARQLKADPDVRDIPLVMLNVQGSEDAIQAGLDAGADEYLTKPVSIADLKLRVRAMVRLRGERRDLLQSYEMRGEQSRVLTILLDYCRALGALDDLDEILDHTVQVTAEVCACRRVSIMLPDEDRRFLTIVRSLGMDEETAQTVRVPIGEPIAGKVFRARQPVVVNSPTENPFAHGAHDMAFFSSTPLTSTALGVAEDIVGVLNVTERVDGHPFEPQELEYLDIVANIAGSAIHGVLTGEARDQARQSIMVALARLAEYRDVDTGRHVDRVTTYCAMLARELRAMGKHTDEISEGFIQDLVRAVPLHDIGKVAVPDQILLKPGHLTEEEMAIMRTHSEIGAGTIRSVIAGAPGVPFLHMAEEIAYGHHEWFNGSGYPRGIKGGDIPLTARIAAVADVYDALTTRRPYKDPFSHQRAASIIKQNAGTQFDPAVVDAFLKREKEFARLAVDLGDESATGGESAGDRSTEHIELVPAR